MPKQRRTHKGSSLSTPAPGTPVSASPASTSSVALLKTCNTCFHAKIRCDRSRETGPCDRCRRLNKECIFAPARRRNASARSRNTHTNRIDQLEQRLNSILDVEAAPRHGQSTESDDARRSSTPSEQLPSLPSLPHVTVTSDGAPCGMSRSPVTSSLAGTCWDPFERAFLSPAEGQTLLHSYSTAMAPLHFPFVLVPLSVSIETLRSEKPCLTLAIMAAASYRRPLLQRRLGHAFRELVAARLLDGELACLDLLQALLVHLAWAHYQPRGRRYSQHLHLAVSIVADLRLDRPNHPWLWKSWLWKGEGTGSPSEQSDWGQDEIRALIGTYVLSSSTSVNLQKLRLMPCSPFIVSCCHKLAVHGGYPTDRNLIHIVRIQQLTEEVDEAVARTDSTDTLHDLNIVLARIREQVAQFKSSLSFSLSGCPMLVFQLHTLDLLLSQLALPGFPFGTAVFQDTIGSGPQLMDCLGASAAAAKSLVGVLLAMTPGEEFALTNLAWIMLAFGLSVAAKLDTLARDARIAALTDHLRRFLDVRHTIRQVNMRLESCVTAEEDENGDRDPFYHLLKRAKAIEAGYLREAGTAAASIAPEQAAGPSHHTTQPADYRDLEPFYNGQTSAAIAPTTVAIDPYLDFGNFSVVDVFAETQDTPLGLYPGWGMQ